MKNTEIYFYSPFSIKTICEEENRSILLQFLLAEYFHGMNIETQKDPYLFLLTSPTSFFPYDWSDEVGCLNKISEHGSLLSHAFPKMKKAANSFNSFVEQLIVEIKEFKKSKKKNITEKFKKDLQRLYLLLQPFIIACKNNEDLLLFLLRNAKKVSQIADPENLHILLKKMHPQGTQVIFHLIRQGYKNRGFDTFLPEIDKILSEYAI